MDLTTTPLLTLTAATIKNTILIVSGLVATLILPFLLTAHLRLYSDAFASSKPAWFALPSFRADLQRSEGLAVTFFMGAMAMMAAYAGAMAFFMQEDVNRGLRLDFAKAAGHGVGLLVGVEVGVCVVYAVFLMFWRGFCWVLGGGEAVAPPAGEPVKDTTEAGKTD